jgi:hypothetical protein
VTIPFRFRSDVVRHSRFHSIAGGASIDFSASALRRALFAPARWCWQKLAIPAIRTVFGNTDRATLQYELEVVVQEECSKKPMMQARGVNISPHQMNRSPLL